MDPNEAYDKLRIAIPMRQDLRQTGWADHHPYAGFCYIATQVFCHLVEEAKPYELARGHFWAQIGDTIHDPTWDQFSGQFAYEKGKRTKFPRGLSKRSSSLLETVLSL